MEFNWQNGIAIAVAGLAALWLVWTLLVPFVVSLRSGKNGACTGSCACCGRGRRSRGQASENVIAEQSAFGAVTGFSAAVADERGGRTMTWKGRVSGGMVVVENGASLPEGAEVRIELQRRSAQVVKSLRAALLRHAGKGCPKTGKAPTEPWRSLLRHAGKGRNLPADLAENHDHYIHGTPKR